MIFSLLKMSIVLISMLEVLACLLFCLNAKKVTKKVKAVKKFAKGHFVNLNPPNSLLS